MKILILSCNTGEGHNSSASALLNAMRRQGIDCSKEDTLALVNEYVSRKVSDIYVFSTRTNLFGPIYRFGETISDANTGIFSGHIKSPIYAANKIYGKNLYDHIVSGHYDAVVCTHLFPAEALTSLKKKANLDIPVIFVMTDYTTIPFINETDCDAYVIPHRHLIEEFVAKGLPRTKLYPLGIPVNTESLLAETKKEEARKTACQIFGWEENNLCHSGRMMLIMGGSMGFGPVGELVDKLLQEIDNTDRIVCVCGRNEKLESTLSSEYSDDKRVKIIGYTENVPLLMHASDVLFSKPGGITSTEAIINNIPLIHTTPIPGLEISNAHFFHYHDMSYYTEDVEEQVRMALQLCDNKSLRDTMLEAQRRNANHNTCEDIIELCKKLI